MVAAGFSVKNFQSLYIPLYQRGTYPPFEKGGQGDLSSSGVKHFWFMNV